MRCYIGLGTNLGDPLAQAKAARRHLIVHPDIDLIVASSLYRSRPMGPQDQPDYLNAVLEVETPLPPLALLDALQAIENMQGRERKRRWGERSLDLDLLLYAHQQIKLTRLTVPHAGIKEREFVLLPLAEIAPSLCLPDGDTIQALANNVPLNGLERYLAPDAWL